MPSKIKKWSAIFCLIIIVSIAQKAEANLSGRLRYSYEDNYSDWKSSNSYFTQEYNTNLSGRLIEDRIGSYNLGLQYQRGVTELRDVNFSTTLNFRDSLRVTTSYFGKDQKSLIYNLNPISDNRMSVSASYYNSPYLPSLTVAYETGTSKAATEEGLNKLDKKAEVGMNYAIGQQSIAAKYIKSVLYDATFASSGSSLTRKDDNLSVIGSSNLGDVVSLNGSYFDQRISNQSGGSSSYLQKLQNLTAYSDIKLIPLLTIRPEMSSRTNFIDYITTSLKSYQQSREIDLSAILKPGDVSELIVAFGGGPVEFDDALGFRRQNMAKQMVKLSTTPAENLSVDVDMKKELYTGENTGGSAYFLNGRASYYFLEKTRVALRKAQTSYSGDVYVVSAGGIRREDVNEGDVEVALLKNLFFEGGASYTTVDDNRYRGINAGLKFTPTGKSSISFARENKHGYETSQRVFYQTDSIGVSFPAGGADVSGKVDFIKSTSTASAQTLDYNGFKSYADVNYNLGDSQVNFVSNSEKRDQYSNVYTRNYVSFSRSF